MKRVLKFGLVALGSLLLAAVVAGGALYFFTAGTYSVAATVVDDPKLPRLEIGGYAFHAEEFGRPLDQALIVLHGGPGGDYRSLLGLETLADRYHVVFYDQRGSGLSERVAAGGQTLAAHLADLDAIVDRYGNGRPVVLVGHSWGAMLLTAYLAHAPQKVDRAVLMEPGYFNAQEQQAWQAHADQFLSGPGFLWQAVLAGFEAQHVAGPDAEAGNDHLMGRMIELFANHPDNPYHCPGEAYDAPIWRFGGAASSAMQANMSSDDYDSIGAGARSFGNPVLVLAGACDTWIGPTLQAKHAESFGNATLEVIPQSGHDVVWDNPDATLAAIGSFLAR